MKIKARKTCHFPNCRKGNRSRFKELYCQCMGHAVESLLKLDAFDENSLYENLNWLAKNKKRIEKDIFNFRFKG